MNQSFIIGVAGGTGSGKTTISEKVSKHFSHNSVYIPHDRYYKDQSAKSMEERLKTNYDHPESLETELLIEHLSQLQQGKTVEIPEYDFTHHTRKLGVTSQILPAPLIILEGILILENETLRKMLDLTVFVDVPADIRILRRTIRDIKERGRTLESCYEQYVTFTRPMHEKFVEPTKEFADLIIPGGGYNEKGVQAIIHTIEDRLR